MPYYQSMIFYSCIPDPDELGSIYIQIEFEKMIRALQNVVAEVDGNRTFVETSIESESGF